MKTIRTLPKSLLYKYIRNKKIKVNRKRCEISQRLQTGDLVQCYIAEEFFETKADERFLHVPSHISYLYEDENIMLLNKPSGLLVHSDSSQLQDNLFDRFLHYLYCKNEYQPAQAQSFTPALCHRIDRNTQGIVIAAKNAAALREMNERIRNREIRKFYLCIVEGVLDKKEDIVTLWHKKAEGNRAVLLSQPKEGFQKTMTRYRVLDSKHGKSLLEVELITGKSHQIRAVMAYLKHPLYGDVKYGAAKNGSHTYQALSAYKLQFCFQSEGRLAYLNHKTFCLQKNDVEALYQSL